MKRLTPKIKLNDAEILKLQNRIVELEQALDSIQSGKVDALVIHKNGQEEVYTLEGADQPYRILVESMEDGALTLTEDGKILHCNKSFATMLNMPTHHIIDTSLFNHIPKQQHPALHSLITKSKLKADKKKFTLLVNHNLTKTVMLACHQLKLGSINGISIIVTDITDIEIEKTKRKKSITALKISEKIFRQFAENIHEVFFRISPSLDKTIYVSPAYEIIWGRTVDELYKNSLAWYESVLPEDRDNLNELFLMAKNDIDNINFEYRILRPDGEIRTIFARATLLKDNNNHPINIIGIATDITERKKNEIALQASLREKEAMLKEIYHRVKNNLQVISSLLNLQARNITDKKNHNIFIESTARVRAMALVHEMLYQSGNLAEIEMGRYVRSLVNNLASIYHLDSRIKLNIDADTISLNIENAIPYGLIINELISNAIKYAFPGDKSGKIDVTIKNQADNIVLVVRDNGVGLSDTINFEQATTLGLKLVHTLTKQLAGVITMDTKKGTEFTLVFSNKT